MAPPLQLHNIYNTVSGHSHTLDMAIHENSIRDSRLGRDVTSIVAALHASWHVARPSARGMCSMNTSSYVEWDQLANTNSTHCEARLSKLARPMQQELDDSQLAR